MQASERVMSAHSHHLLAVAHQLLHESGNVATRQWNVLDAASDDVSVRQGLICRNKVIHESTQEGLLLGVRKCHKTVQIAEPIYVHNDSKIDLLRNLQ